MNSFFWFIFFVVCFLKAKVTDQRLLWSYTNYIYELKGIFSGQLESQSTNGLLKRIGVIVTGTFSKPAFSGMLKTHTQVIIPSSSLLKCGAPLKKSNNSWGRALGRTALFDTTSANTQKKCPESDEEMITKLRRNADNSFSISRLWKSHATIRS